jgi:hypothetical protein
MTFEYLPLFVMVCWLCAIFFLLRIEPLHRSDKMFCGSSAQPLQDVGGGPAEDEFVHPLQADEIINASIIKLDRYSLERQSLDIGSSL